MGRYLLLCVALCLGLCACTKDEESLITKRTSEFMSACADGDFTKAATYCDTGVLDVLVVDESEEIGKEVLKLTGGTYAMLKKMDASTMALLKKFQSDFNDAVVTGYNVNNDYDDGTLTVDVVYHDPYSVALSSLTADYDALWNAYAEAHKAELQAVKDKDGQDAVAVDIFDALAPQYAGLLQNEYLDKLSEETVTWTLSWDEVDGEELITQAETTGKETT